MKNLIAFLILNYCLILAVVSLANLVTGTAKSIADNSFNWSKAITGVKDLVMLAIGYVAFGSFAYTVQGVTFEGIDVFTKLFTFLTILIIAYKGNSLAMHFIELAKIPVPAVMVTIDEKIKAMFAESKPASVITGQDDEIIGQG